MSETILFDSGELVLASRDDRVVTGRLVPFGVVGKTNVGGFTVEAGAISLPADPSIVTLNVEHDREQPVGRAIALDERGDGIYASFRLARTPEGDAALEDIATGRRKSLSMEAKGVIVRAGKAIAGRIFGSGLVERPAFEGATVIASFADDGQPVSSVTTSDHSETTYTDSIGDATYVTTSTTDTTTTTETTVTDPDEDDDEDEDEDDDTEPDAATVTASQTEEEHTVPTATVPESVMAKANGAPAANTSKPLTAKRALTVLAHAAAGSLTDMSQLDAVLKGTEQKSVYAAQTNIDFPVGDAENLNVAQWLGEFWGLIQPVPLVTDLLTPFDITSRIMQGYRPTTLPKGSTWAGNGAEIASGPLTFTPSAYTARNWAGGNTVSRENFDFGADTALLESYYTYQGWNFQQWLDQAVISNILYNFTSVIADEVPTSPAIDAGTSALVDGIAKYVVTRRQAPTFALVSETYWKAMMKAPVVAQLAELSQSLGLLEGDLVGIQRRMVPDSYLNDGKNQFHVLVGNKKAGKVGVLPGSPVRAQVVNVANGEISLGAYGYGTYIPQAAGDFVGVLPAGATYDDTRPAPAVTFDYALANYPA